MLNNYKTQPTCETHTHTHTLTDKTKHRPLGGVVLLARMKIIILAISYAFCSHLWRHQLRDGLRAGELVASVAAAKAKVRKPHECHLLHAYWLRSAFLSASQSSVLLTASLEGGEKSALPFVYHSFAYQQKNYRSTCTRVDFRMLSPGRPCQLATRLANWPAASILAVGQSMSR